jgi:hypothetical protein
MFGSHFEYFKNICMMLKKKEKKTNLLQTGVGTWVPSVWKNKFLIL